MKINRQLQIDRYVVKPLLILLNWLVRLVGIILRPNHSLERSFKRIAICKFKGMGSIVQAGSLINGLRAKYPKARIVFISTKANQQILKQISEIDDTILLNDNSMYTLIKSFFPFLIKLIKERFGLYFDLEIYSNFSSLICTLSMARNRFGFYLRDTQYRMGVYTHMMYFNTAVPIADCYAQMGRYLEIPESDFRPISLPAENKAPLNGSYLCINVNASDLRRERRWPAEHYRHLIAELLSWNNIDHIVLIGSPAERAYVSELIKGISHEKLLNMAGKTTIPELLTLLKHARLVVTNDSGPMHLASAVGGRILALFGPCSPEQYGKMDGLYSIYKSIYCSPCVHEFDRAPCLGDNQCMKLIKPEEVMSNLRALLQSSPKPTFKDVRYRAEDGKLLGRVFRSGDF